MPQQSAGLLLFRKQEDHLEFFLVHPGGPFWAKKDLGSWSIPKGEFDREDPLLAAKREFYEETGLPAPEREYIPLAPIKQKGGKIVYAWGVEAEIDASKIHSNCFEMEWPPRSGKRQSFPEIDKGAWFAVEDALEKIVQGQVGLIHELVERLAQ
jgi:predicted NUDIX family NTP pyrophosphohydrolase